MPRSVLVLLILVIAGVAAGVLLDRRVSVPDMSAPQPAPAALPDLANAADAMSALTPEAGPRAITSDAQESQIKVLQEQVAYLEQQNETLLKENSQLLDKLASLTGKPPGNMSAATTEPPPCDPASTLPPKDAPDFVGIGIELVKLRGIQDIPIPTVTVERAEVEGHIARWLATQVTPGHGALQGRALAALGAIPQPVDTIALKAAFLAHQIGGWYDPADQTLYLARTGEAGMVAEKKENALGLSYSLLLKRYGPTLYPANTKITTLDARLARDTLLAGDAALLRFLHALQNPAKGGGGGVGEDPDDPSRAVPIPNFLREVELLPFAVGFDFMQAMHSIGGWEQVNAAYKRPPIAGPEVLDPQVYLNETPFALQPIELGEAKVNGAAPLWQDTLGPMATVILLKQRVPEPIATDTAPGWTNDRLLIYAAKDQPRDHAVWQTRWRSSDAADAFFSAARQWLQGRYKTAQPAANAPAGVFALETGERSVHLQRTHNGTGVLLIDAADAAFVKAAAQMATAPQAK